MYLFQFSQHNIMSADRHEFWIYFLAYANSALNPIIYGGFNKSYRAALLRIIGRGKRRKYSTMFYGKFLYTISLNLFISL